MADEIPRDGFAGHYERTRSIATGLLLGMASLFVAALMWEPAYPSLAWLRAFAEAAMVGALADWYAVTALFRRPLGLPIPHSQIIPRNKERIASRIGSLTQRQLLTPDAIGKLVESWRISHEFIAVLLDPPRRQVLTQEAALLLARILEASDDAAMQQFTRHLVTRVLRGVSVAPLIGRLFEAFLKSAQRDRLLNDALAVVDEYIETHRSELCSLIAEKLPWSRFLRFVNLEDKVAGKVVDWLTSMLHEMQDNPDDPLRAQLLERMEAAAEWLIHSERALEREALFKEKLLTYDALAQFIDDSWHRLKRWLLSDLREKHSETSAYLDAALAGLGDALRMDQEFVTLFEQGLKDVVIDLATRHHDQIGELVTKKIRDWSSSHMVETIEREVGTDLQFIRINGAVVGGIVGLLLHGSAVVIGKL